MFYFAETFRTSGRSTAPVVQLDTPTSLLSPVPTVGPDAAQATKTNCVRFRVTCPRPENLIGELDARRSRNNKNLCKVPQYKLRLHGTTSITGLQIRRQIRRQCRSALQFYYQKQ